MHFYPKHYNIINNMKAIILAAGLGTRLGELTKNNPKCLVRINSKTILENQLEILKEGGIKDITIVIGDQGSCWTKENKDKIKSLHEKVVISEDNLTTNNSHSLRLGMKDIEKDDLLIMDGDMVIKKDLIKKIINSNTDLILLKESYNEDPGNKVLLDKTEKIIEIDRDSRKFSLPYLIYSGLMLIKKKNFSLFKELLNREQYYPLDLGYLLKELCKKIDMIGLIDNNWINVNSPADLDKAKTLIHPNFLALMYGYTFVGKSSTAKKISQIENTDIFHSAIVRKEMDLSPKTPEEADKFFDYRNNLREEVDRKVYGELANRAEKSLQNKKNAIIDAGNFFKWQRENPYGKAIKNNAEIFVIKVICPDETEIKRRFEERLKNFQSSPLNETPSMNTYEATKLVTEPVEKDIMINGEIPRVIEYNTFNKKARIIQGNKDSENAKKILEVLEPKNILVQDENFNLIEKKENEVLDELKGNFIIALDFDGVVTSPHELKTKYINEFGYDLTKEQCSYEVSVKKLGVEKEKYREANIKADTQPPEKLPLEENFLENFSKIRSNNKIKIIIVTSRFDFMIEHLKNYLKHHGIKIDGIMNTCEKTKTQALKNINANIFVEDGASKLKDILDEDKNIINKTKLVLFRHIQNKVIEKPNENIIEIDNWNDLHDFIMEEYKKFLSS